MLTIAMMAMATAMSTAAVGQFMEFFSVSIDGHLYAADNAATANDVFRRAPVTGPNVRWYYDISSSQEVSLNPSFVLRHR
ncbi:hypothetical protein [Nocardia sp. BMG51109]|uniref:hypothetical protein n=1 Tax=Nocardia sp. BMG51109 TaxID=1056816 RepID=UPI0012EC6F89|nr:hypothetical protein [Nocardia sp. BMG51109]